MKSSLIALFFLPVVCFAQKVRVNEYDKFVKQTRIELEPFTILSSEKSNVSLAFNSLGNGMYVQFSGFGWGASTVDAGHEIIFLFSNDSTATARSTGLQSYDVMSTRNNYKHKYAVLLSTLEALSKYELVGIRKYSFNDYSDMKVPKDCAAKIKKSTMLFVEELKKSNVIRTLKQINVKDIAKHIGDSVIFSAKIFNTRYFEASENAPTLLDINNSYGLPLVNIVIWRQDRKNFTDAPEILYNNREVRISGVVQLYNNLPQIVISKKQQVTVTSPVLLDEISKFVGDTVTVEGKIFSGKFIANNSSSPTLLNMGANYPDQLLTLVIESPDRPKFKAEPENYYLSKDVVVRGKVSLYKDKPQITVSEVSQIVEKPGQNSLTVVEKEKSTGGTAKDTVQKKAIINITAKASFPGGQEALAEFLKANLVCPEELQSGDKIQIVASFRIRPDGKAANFAIVQSAGPAYDTEVLRVLKLMPSWRPQIKDGLAVNENIIQPVTFKR